MANFEKELASFNADLILNGDVMEAAKWLSPRTMRRLYRVIKSEYDSHDNVNDPLEGVAVGDTWGVNSH